MVNIFCFCSTDKSNDREWITRGQIRVELLEHFMGDCMGLDLKSRAGLFESQLMLTLDQKLTNVVIFLVMFFTSCISCKLRLLNLKQKAKQYK